MCVPWAGRDYVLACTRPLGLLMIRDILQIREILVRQLHRAVIVDPDTTVGLEILQGTAKGFRGASGIQIQLLADGSLGLGRAVGEHFEDRGINRFRRSGIRGMIQIELHAAVTNGLGDDLFEGLGTMIQIELLAEVSVGQDRAVGELFEEKLRVGLLEPFRRADELLDPNLVLLGFLHDLKECLGTMQGQKTQIVFHFVRRNNFWDGAFREQGLGRIHVVDLTRGTAEKFA